MKWPIESSVCRYAWPQEVAIVREAYPLFPAWITFISLVLTRISAHCTPWLQSMARIGFSSTNLVIVVFWRLIKTLVASHAHPCKRNPMVKNKGQSKVSKIESGILAQNWFEDQDWPYKKIHGFKTRSEGWKCSLVGGRSICFYSILTGTREPSIPYDTLRVSPIDMYIQEVEITSTELVKLL